MTEYLDKHENEDEVAESLQVGRRLQNIERLIETVGDVAAQGVESWSESQKRKAEGEEHARTLEDSQHRRACWVLVYFSALVFLLAGLSFWKNQYELVKQILTSSLAIAAGVGLTSVFKAKKSPEK